MSNGSHFIRLHQASSSLGRRELLRGDDLAPRAEKIAHRLALRASCLVAMHYPGVAPDVVVVWRKPLALAMEAALASLSIELGRPADASALVRALPLQAAARVLREAQRLQLIGKVKFAHYGTDFCGGYEHCSVAVTTERRLPVGPAGDRESLFGLEVSSVVEDAWTTGPILRGSEQAAYLTAQASIGGAREGTLKLLLHFGREAPDFWREPTGLLDVRHVPGPRPISVPSAAGGRIPDADQLAVSRLIRLSLKEFGVTSGPLLLRLQKMEWAPTDVPEDPPHRTSLLLSKLPADEQKLIKWVAGLVPLLGAGAGSWRSVSNPGRTAAWNVFAAPGVDAQAAIARLSSIKEGFIPTIMNKEDPS